MTVKLQSTQDLATTAAREALAAGEARLVRVWLQSAAGEAPHLIASAGDAAFAPASEAAVASVLSAGTIAPVMSACGDVPNGFLCVPIVFGDRALGCIEVFASEPIGFARAGEIERQAGEFGALLAMVLSTDAVEGAPRGRILIADDDAQIRALLVALLERRGFECIDVPNGWAAYEAAQRERPDLVLIDWMMPVMDGRETVARLKADPSTRDIPVVMLTGQSQIDDKVAALEAGVQDFITKPFDSRELVARVEQQLRWRRLLSDADEAAGSAPAAPMEVPLPETATDTSGDLWTRATEATALGKHAEALTLFVLEAETSEAKNRFPRAAIAYRSAAVEAGRQQKPSLSNKLLRLAGKMYLCGAEATNDVRAIQDGYVNAARCFLSAGNLQMAKKSIDFASSYDSVLSDASPAPDS